MTSLFLPIHQHAAATDNGGQQHGARISFEISLQKHILIAFAVNNCPFQFQLGKDRTRIKIFEKEVTKPGG
jgi:hypothetical protein